VLDKWIFGFLLNGLHPPTYPSSNPSIHQSINPNFAQAVSQPMRWALAMTEKVIVVAGTPGKTVASTA
jgi:hypothetical protein